MNDSPETEEILHVPFTNPLQIQQALYTTVPSMCAYIMCVCVPFYMKMLTFLSTLFYLLVDTFFFFFI